MSKIKICIDVGHYGKYNQSPCNPKYYESEAMWKLHIFLKNALEEFGIEVITTRDRQSKDLPLLERGKKAKGCNLFISLHSNAISAGKRDDIDYPVAYVIVDGTADNIANLLTACVETVMGTKQKARIEKRYSAKDKDSNGVLDDNYYGVLSGCDSVGVPGLILEHSFHTSTPMTNWLLNEENLKKLATAEAKVIANYFEIQDEYVPAKSVSFRSSVVDIEWLQTKLLKALPNINKILPLEVSGVYDDITRIYVLIFWYQSGLGKDMTDDGLIAGKKTIELLKKY